MISFFKKNEKSKIFCISFQRTGTTSVGRFFIENGFKVQGYNRDISTQWSLDYLKGDLDSIFNSKAFKYNQVFEDNPWWFGDFYRFLFHKFPDSKFILFERDSDKWFNSMVNHSNGKTLGNTYRHCKLYNREDELYEITELYKPYNLEIDNLLPLNESHREHYITIYERRNREIKEFFHLFGAERLINLQLEDPEKWQKLATFFNMKINDDYNVHANKTNK